MRYFLYLLVFAASLSLTTLAVNTGSAVRVKAQIPEFYNADGFPIATFYDTERQVWSAAALDWRTTNSTIKIPIALTDEERAAIAEGNRLGAPRGFYYNRNVDRISVGDFDDVPLFDTSPFLAAASYRHWYVNASEIPDGKELSPNLQWRCTSLKLPRPQIRCEP